MPLEPLSMEQKLAYFEQLEEMLEKRRREQARAAEASSGSALDGVKGVGIIIAGLSIGGLPIIGFPILMCALVLGIDKILKATSFSDLSKKLDNADIQELKRQILDAPAPGKEQQAEMDGKGEGRRESRGKGEGREKRRRSESRSDVDGRPRNIPAFIPEDELDSFPPRVVSAIPMPNVVQAAPVLQQQASSTVVQGTVVTPPHKAAQNPSLQQQSGQRPALYPDTTVTSPLDVGPQSKVPPPPPKAATTTVSTQSDATDPVVMVVKPPPVVGTQSKVVADPLQQQQPLTGTLVPPPPTPPPPSLVGDGSATGSSVFFATRDVRGGARARPRAQTFSSLGVASLSPQALDLQQSAVLFRPTPTPASSEPQDQVIQTATTTTGMDAADFIDPQVAALQEQLARNEAALRAARETSQSEIDALRAEHAKILAAERDANAAAVSELRAKNDTLVREHGELVVDRDTAASSADTLLVVTKKAGDLQEEVDALTAGIRTATKRTAATEARVDDLSTQLLAATAQNQDERRNLIALQEATAAQIFTKEAELLNLRVSAEKENMARAAELAIMRLALDSATAETAALRNGNAGLTQDIEAANIGREAVVAEVGTLTSALEEARRLQAAAVVETEVARRELEAKAKALEEKQLELKASSEELARTKVDVVAAERVRDEAGADLAALRKEAADSIVVSDELKRKIAEKEAEFSQASDAFAITNGQNESAIAALTATNLAQVAAVGLLEVGVAELKDTIAQSSRVNDEQARTIAAQEADLAAKEKAIVTKDAEIVDLTGTLRERDAALAVSEQTLMEQTETLRATAARTNEAEAALADKVAELELATTKLARQGDDLDKQAAQLQLQGEELSTLQGKLEAADARVDEVGSELAVVQNAVVQLQDTNAELQSRMQAEAAAAREREEGKDATIVARDSTITSQSERLDALDRDLGAAKLEVSGLTAQVSDITPKLKAATLQVQQLEMANEAMEVARAKAEAEKAAAERVVAERDAAIKAKDMAHAEEMAVLRQQLLDAQKATETATANAAALKDSLAESAVIRAKLLEAAKLPSTREGEIKSLKDKLAAKEAEVAALRETNEAVTAKAVTNSGTVVELRNQVAVLEATSTAEKAALAREKAVLETKLQAANLEKKEADEARARQEVELQKIAASAKLFADVALGERSAMADALARAAEASQRALTEAGAARDAEIAALREQIAQKDIEINAAQAATTAAVVNRDTTVAAVQQQSVEQISAIAEREAEIVRIQAELESVKQKAEIEALKNEYVVAGVKHNNELDALEEIRSTLSGKVGDQKEGRLTDEVIFESDKISDAEKEQLRDANVKVVEAKKAQEAIQDKLEALTPEQQAEFGIDKFDGMVDKLTRDGAAMRGRAYGATRDALTEDHAVEVARLNAALAASDAEALDARVREAQANKERDEANSRASSAEFLAREAEGVIRGLEETLASIPVVDPNVAFRELHEQQEQKEQAEALKAQQQATIERLAAKLEEQERAARSREDALAAQLQAALVANDGLRIDLDESIGRNDGLFQRGSDALAKVYKLTSANADLVQERDDAVVDRVEEVTRLSRIIEGIEQEKDAAVRKLEETVRQQQDAIGDLEAKKVGLVEEHAQLEGRLFDSNRKNRRLEEELAVQIAATHNVGAEAEQAKQETQKVKAAADERTRQQRAVLDKQAADLKAAQDSLAVASAEKASLATQLLEAQSKAAADTLIAQEAIERLGKFNEMAVRGNAIASAMLIAAEKNAETVAKANEVSAARVTELEAAIAAQQVAHASAIAAATSTHLSAIEKMQQDHVNALASRDTAVTDLERERDAAHTEASATKQQLAAVVSERDSLQGELSTTKESLEAATTKAALAEREAIIEQERFATALKEEQGRSASALAAANTDHAAAIDAVRKESVVSVEAAKDTLSKSHAEELSELTKKHSDDDARISQLSARAMGAEEELAAEKDRSAATLAAATSTHTSVIERIQQDHAAELASRAAERADVERERDSARAETSTTKQQLAAVVSERDSLQGELSTTQASLVAATSTHVSATENMQQTHAAELAALQFEALKQEYVVADLQQSNASKEREYIIDSLTKKYDVKEPDLEITVEVESDEYTRAIDARQARILERIQEKDLTAEERAELTGAIERADITEKNRKALEERLVPLIIVLPDAEQEQIKEDVTKRIEALKASEKPLQEASKTIKALKEAENVLNEKLSAAESDITRLIGGRNAALEEVSTTQASLEAATIKAAEAQRRFEDQAKAHLAEVTSMQQAQASALASLSTERDAARLETSTTKTSLEAAHADTLRGVTATNAAAIDAVRKESAITLAAEVESAIKAERVRHAAELAAAQEQVQSAEAKVVASTTRTAVLEQEHDALASQLRDKDAEFAAAQQKFMQEQISLKDELLEAQHLAAANALLADAEAAKHDSFVEMMGKLETGNKAATAAIVSVAESARVDSEAAKAVSLEQVALLTAQLGQLQQQNQDREIKHLEESTAKAADLTAMGLQVSAAEAERIVAADLAASVQARLSELEARIASGDKELASTTQKLEEKQVEVASLTEALDATRSASVASEEKQAGTVSVLTAELDAAHNRALAEKIARETVEAKLDEQRSTSAQREAELAKELEQDRVRHAQELSTVKAERDAANDGLNAVKKEQGEFKDVVLEEAQKVNALVAELRADVQRNVEGWKKAVDLATKLQEQKQENEARNAEQLATLQAKQEADKGVIATQKDKIAMQEAAIAKGIVREEQLDAAVREQLGKPSVSTTVVAEMRQKLDEMAQKVAADAEANKEELAKRDRENKSLQDQHERDSGRISQLETAAIGTDGLLSDAQRLRDRAVKAKDVAEAKVSELQDQLAAVQKPAPKVATESIGVGTDTEDNFDLPPVDTTRGVPVDFSALDDDGLDLDVRSSTSLEVDGFGDLDNPEPAVAAAKPDEIVLDDEMEFNDSFAPPAEKNIIDLDDDGVPSPSVIGDDPEFYGLYDGDESVASEASAEFNVEPGVSVPNRAFNPFANGIVLDDDDALINARAGSFDSGVDFDDIPMNVAVPTASGTVRKPVDPKDLGGDDEGEGLPPPAKTTIVLEDDDVPSPESNRFTLEELMAFDSDDIVLPETETELEEGTGIRVGDLVAGGDHEEVDLYGLEERVAQMHATEADLKAAIQASQTRRILGDMEIEELEGQSNVVEVNIPRVLQKDNEAELNKRISTLGESNEAGVQSLEKALVRTVTLKGKAGEPDRVITSEELLAEREKAVKKLQEKCGALSDEVRKLRKEAGEKEEDSPAVTEELQKFEGLVASFEGTKKNIGGKEAFDTTASKELLERAKEALGADANLTIEEKKRLVADLEKDGEKIEGQKALLQDRNKAVQACITKSMDPIMNGGSLICDLKAEKAVLETHLKERDEALLGSQAAPSPAKAATTLNIDDLLGDSVSTVASSRVPLPTTQRQGDIGSLAGLISDVSLQHQLTSPSSSVASSRDTVPHKVEPAKKEASAAKVVAKPVPPIYQNIKNPKELCTAVLAGIQAAGLTTSAKPPFQGDKDSPEIAAIKELLPKKGDVKPSDVAQALVSEIVAGHKGKKGPVTGDEISAAARKVKDKIASPNGSKLLDTVAKTRDPVVEKVVTATPAATLSTTTRQGPPYTNEPVAAMQGGIVDAKDLAAIKPVAIDPVAQARLDAESKKRVEGLDIL